MIDAIAIMKAIEHLESPGERQKEAFRLIKEREDEHMRRIEEESAAFTVKHEAYMLKLQKNQDDYIMRVQIRIQEIRARIPKRQIYFGKVKTE